MSILSFLRSPAKHQTGVYKIVNRKTGWVYIGATTQPMVVRWEQHRRGLRGNRHHNSRLQADWNTHGARAFRFSVVEVTDADYVFIHEKQWQRKYYPAGKCYNPNPDAPPPYMKPSAIPRDAKLYLYRIMRGSIPKTKENIRRALEGCGVRCSEELWEEGWQVFLGSD